MTKEEQEKLHQHETRVRQLILKYKALDAEAQELYAMVDERDQKIRQQEEEIESWKKKYETLKVARMIDITSADVEGAQKRIAELIRDIDKCIALLNL